MLRRVASSIAAVAVVASGLVWGAAPASATGEEFSSMSPTSGAVSSTATFTFNVTLDTNAVNGSSNPTIAGYYLTLPGFDWSGLSCNTNVTFSPALTGDSGLDGYCAGFVAGKGLNFASPYITGTPTKSYTVTVTGLRVPAAGGTYDVGLANWDASVTFATRAFTAEAPPGAFVVTIDIDGNGGRCLTSKITGYSTTWATAPGAEDCSGNGVFTGFDTSADGSGIAIAPGGNLNLTTDNTLYAQYTQPRTSSAPTDVVAAGGYKNVKVSWTAPTDQGTSPVAAYLVQANPGGATCITNQASANILECTYTNLVPGTDYSFKVQALNQAGWSEFSAASNVVTPYDLKLDTVSRPEVKLLFIKRGSTLEAQGRTPGLAAGAVLTPVLQLGSDGVFVPLTKDTTKVDGNGNFTWSRKLGKSDNGKPASLYFTYGDGKTATLTAKLGATIGLPSAPREVKVTSGIDGITVSWQPPARDGGSPIVEYVMTSDAPAPSWARSRVIACTVKAPVTSCTMKGNVSRLDPSMDYTFSVAAKTERGTSPQATTTWKGQVYSLNIFRTLRSGSDVTLSFTATGWANPAQSFEVQAKVGAAGAWKKQGTARLDPDYVQSIGDWEGQLPKSATAGTEVSYRLKSDRGYSNVVTFRPKSG